MLASVVRVCPFRSVRPVDVLVCVLTLESEVSNNATFTIALTKAGLEEPSRAHIVAAVKLCDEHVVLFAFKTCAGAVTFGTVLLAVTTDESIFVVPLVWLAHA